LSHIPHLLPELSPHVDEKIHWVVEYQSFIGNRTQVSRTLSECVSKLLPRHHPALRMLCFSSKYILILGPLGWKVGVPASDDRSTTSGPRTVGVHSPGVPGKQPPQCSHATYRQRALEPETSIPWIPLPAPGRCCRSCSGPPSSGPRSCTASGRRTCCHDWGLGRCQGLGTASRGGVSGGTAQCPPAGTGCGWGKGRGPDQQRGLWQSGEAGPPGCDTRWGKSRSRCGGRRR
jgi:hypothetical protein